MVRECVFCAASASISCIFDNVFQQKKIPLIATFQWRRRWQISLHLYRAVVVKKVYLPYHTKCEYISTLAFHSERLNSNKKGREIPSRLLYNILMLSHDKINIWRRIRVSLKLRAIDFAIMTFLFGWEEVVTWHGASIIFHP